MCTISFIPKKDGYLLAMNRDELKSRAVAVPPSLHQFNSLSLVYPQESSGGTWIGANSRGTLLALMNANAPEDPNLAVKSVSRGEIIPALLHEYSALEMDQALRALPLAGMHPFRLFAIFPLTREIEQWDRMVNTRRPAHKNGHAIIGSLQVGLTRGRKASAVGRAKCAGTRIFRTPSIGFGLCTPAIFPTRGHFLFVSTAKKLQRSAIPKSIVEQTKCR